jgi:hypothetical protein
MVGASGGLRLSACHREPRRIDLDLFDRPIKSRRPRPPCAPHVSVDSRLERRRATIEGLTLRAGKGKP